jgi:drug/metabolite transporter (DMT)-like permease
VNGPARASGTRAAPAGRRPGGPALRLSRRSAGVVLGLLSAMFFGTSGTFGSALIAAGWSPAGAVLGRISIAALALTGPALVTLRGRWSLLRRSAWPMIAFGLIGVDACQVCYFNAIARMDVGIAILVEYMSIVLIVGWLWLRHGQRPRLLTVAGVIAALGGLALMLDLSGSVAVSIPGVLWATAAAAALAAYFFQSADGSGGLPPVVLTWGGMVVGSIVLAALGLAGLVPLRFTGGEVQLQGHSVNWVVPLLGLSLMAAALAYVSGIAAARRLGAKLGSFVAMAEVLFAVAFAWVLLHQAPAATQLAGGALILLGVIAVRLDEPA